MSKSRRELEDDCLHRLYSHATLQHRRLIDAARSEGVEWRGECYTHFLRVVGEVELAAQLRPADYRFEAVRFLKSLNVGARLPYDKTRRED